MNNKLKFVLRESNRTILSDPITTLDVYRHGESQPRYSIIFRMYDGNAVSVELWRGLTRVTLDSSTTKGKVP